MPISLNIPSPHCFVDFSLFVIDPLQQLQNLIDAGDIIGVHGTVKRTEKGEISVYVKDWQLLTKALLPLPDKYHGLTDINKRHRLRHLDMIVNPEVRRTFLTRARMTSALRRRLDELGYIEIETPILQAQAGGADATPFETYHHALEMTLTLRIATELHLKRLIIGGFNRGKRRLGVRNHVHASSPNLCRSYLSISLSFSVRSQCMK